MEALPARIAKRWSDRVRTGVEVTGVEPADQGWRVMAGGEEYACERLVIATDARTAARLVAPLDPALARALDAIEYPPLATVVSLYRREDVAHPLDGFGCLVPEIERRDVLGIIFSSSLFPDRAPEGMVALTTFIGGARQPEHARLGDRELRAIVEREHAALLGATAPAISVDITRWERAIPQYTLGYGAILDVIALSEGRHPGLYLAGNYRGGVSVGDCIGSALALADRLASGEAGSAR